MNIFKILETPKMFLVLSRKLIKNFGKHKLLSLGFHEHSDEIEFGSFPTAVRSLKAQNYMCSS